jgi:hypothetical protein
MKRPTASCPGNALGDAIGVSWLLREVDGMTVAAHGGGTNGQISAFHTIPERGFAIAVLTNASTGGELTGALLEWVLQRWLGIEPQRYEPMPASDIDPLEYAGTYQSQSSVVRLEITDGKLLATPERTEVGKRWSAIFAGQQAEKLLPPPFKIELLDGERIRPQDGPPGPVGSFVREDGDIVGLTFGGRFARRT